MRSRLCMSVVLSASLLAPGWALAETDAASIKSSIEAYVSTMSAEMDDAAVAYDDLSVTESGAGYDVAFKGLTIKDDDGLLVTLGDPSFFVEEVGEDFAFSKMWLPDSITFSHEKEAETGTLSWTLKKGEGLWSPVLEELKGLDMAMSDVKIVVDEGGESSKQMVALLGDVAMKGMTEEVSATDWNQSSSASFGPIDVKDPEGDGALAIGSIEITSLVTGLNPGSYQKHVALMDQLGEAHEMNDQAKIDEIKNEIQGLALVAQGGQVGVVIKDVDFMEHKGDQVHFVMEETSLVFRGSAPADAETGSMGLTLMGVGAKYEGADLQGEDKLAAMVAPNDWDVNIELSKLPIKETSQAIVELIFAGIGIQDEPMIPFPQIMAAMGQAGSEVLVDSLSLVGPLASLDGEAKATVDPASAMGAVGDATLKLIGLAKLEAAISDLPAEMQQDIAGGLVFLKGLGAPEPDGDDINYVYEFSLPADGNITLNGQPMGALLGN